MANAQQQSKPITEKTGAQERGVALPLPQNNDTQQDLKELQQFEADLAADRKLKDTDDVKRDLRNISQLEKDVLKDWQTPGGDTKRG